MTSLNIGWPLEEPQWIDFQEGFVVFGDAEFLEYWDGLDPSVSDSYIKAGFNKQWHRLVADKAGWLFGDMPGLLAPSTGYDAANANGKKLLAIWELIVEQDGFVLPDAVVLSPSVCGAAIYSTTLDTRRREFRIFSLSESCDTLLARRDLPIFYFEDCDSKLEVLPVKLTIDGRKGEFLVHLFSQGFERLIWQV